MIDLQRHIEILLLEGDCVIVPGFGGFMAHHVDARYDEGDGAFLPPLRAIGFNPQLKVNDSLLAQSYIEAYDISYPEALRRIEDEVGELRQRIDNDGSYEMTDLGTLSRGEGGSIVFEPCEAGLLTPDYYGLGSFEMPRLEALPATVDVKTEREAGTPDAPKATTTQPSLRDIMDAGDTDDNGGERRVSIRVSVLQGAMAAAIVIIAFLLFPVRLGNGVGLQTSNIDTGLLTRVMPKADTKTARIKAGQTALPDKGKGEGHLVNALGTRTPPSPSARKPEKESLGASEKENSFYTIVLASRVSRHGAAAFVADLKEHGLKEAAVLPGHKGAKVVFGHYKTEDEARPMLRTLRGKDELRDAWIMHVSTENKL